MNEEFIAFMEMTHTTSKKENDGLVNIESLLLFWK